MSKRARIGPWLAMKAILQEMKVKHPMLFDVGAHYGNVSEFFLRMFDDCTIHAFEPLDSAREKLSQRFIEESKVHVHSRALGAKQQSRRQRLHIGGQHGEMSSFMQRPDPDEIRRYWRHELKESQLTYVDSIDEFCEERQINYIHILKADVQGFELEILKGATNLLNSGDILLLYLEVFFTEMYAGAPLLLDVWKYLTCHDYQLYDIYNVGRSYVNRRLKYADVLFVGPKVVERVLDKFPEEWLPKSRDEALGEPSR